MKSRTHDEGPLASRRSFSPDLQNGGDLLRPSRADAPDIKMGLWQGRPVLIKSYDHCSSAYRQTVGRLAMSREWWALRALSGTGCAPEPVLRPRPWAVVMEWVAGQPLEQVAKGQVESAALVAEAERLLAVMTERGIVHGDLGHDCWSVQGRESNVLLTETGRLVALDFAGCWNLAAPWPLRRLSQALHRHDGLFLTKVLYHLGDDSVVDHPGWRRPSQLGVAWWDLMKVLGKI